MINGIEVAVLVYFVSGGIITGLWALLMMAMYGHRDGLSLSELIEKDSAEKMTVKDWCYLIGAIIIWPIATCFVLWALFTKPEELYNQLDASFETTE